MHRPGFVIALPTQGFEAKVESIMRLKNRLKFAAILSALTLSGSALGQNAPAIQVQAGTEPGPGPSAVVVADEDKANRLTVPVMINDLGPFQFVIDTGADRTVVSSEVANRLKLKTSDMATLHTMNGVDQVRTVSIPKLQVSTAIARNISAPALAERNLGADGLLGIDTLGEQRVVMDFRVPSVTVYDSARTPEPRDPPDMIVVRARARFGQLILVDADIDGRKIYVVVDTGAQNSVANSVLRRMVSRHSRNFRTVPIALVGVTGDSTPADYTALEHVRIGGFTINNAPVAFADAHPFKKFGLSDKPSMLLGMDILRKFDRVSVDFANRKIKFLLPQEANNSLSMKQQMPADPLRMAGLK